MKYSGFLTISTVSGRTEIITCEHEHRTDVLVVYPRSDPRVHGARLQVHPGRARLGHAAGRRGRGTVDSVTVDLHSISGDGETALTVPIHVWSREGALHSGALQRRVWIKWIKEVFGGGEGEAATLDGTKGHFDAFKRTD